MAPADVQPDWWQTRPRGRDAIREQVDEGVRDGFQLVRRLELVLPRTVQVSFGPQMADRELGDARQRLPDARRRRQG